MEKNQIHVRNGKNKIQQGKALTIGSNKEEGQKPKPPAGEGSSSSGGGVLAQKLAKIASKFPS